MTNKYIYMDNGATSKVPEEVIRTMIPYFHSEFGNASSMHTPGQNAKQALEKSRNIIAKSINANPNEIIFTSGGTESNNFAVKSIAFTNRGKGNHIIISKVEHKCIIRSCKWLEKQGFKVTYLDVDEEGFIDPKVLEKAITKDTILVSIIHGNNEIGTIQDLETIGQICKKHNVYFHTDACQAYSLDLDVKKLNVSLLTLNSSKMHGPKGAGLLYIKKGTKIEPLIHGGEQEFNLRSGTENLQAIIGFAKAFELSQENKEQTIKILTNLRDKLIKNILQILDVKLNGHQTLRLPNNVNVSIKGTESETLILHLNDFGIYVSSGSACSSNKIGISHVIKALKVPEEYARGTLRFTLSKYNTEEEIDHVSKMLNKIVNNLKPKLIEVQK